MNQLKTSYEKKCSDYERIIEEKDAAIETLQLDLVVIKDAVLNNKLRIYIYILEINLFRLAKKKLKFKNKNKTKLFY